MNKNMFIRILMVTGLNFLPAQDMDFETRYHYGTIYLQQGFLGQKYIKGG